MRPLTILAGPTVRPIRFTADLAVWRKILEALGATLLVDHGGWLVYQAGSGRLALHGALEGNPAGSTTLGIETPSLLENAIPAAAGKGVPVTLEDTPHGQAGVVHAADGTSFTIDVPAEVGGRGRAEGEGPGTAREPRLTIMQVWDTPDPKAVHTLLRGLGARTRYTDASGAWVDLELTGGGLVGIRTAEATGVELGMEWAGRLEEAQELLAAAGITAELSEGEAGPTLVLPDPDGGAPVWLTQSHADLYSYTLAELD